jgi:hypothetical protein
LSAGAWAQAEGASEALREAGALGDEREGGAFAAQRKGQGLAAPGALEHGGE